jgi:hypothetical protein
MATAIFLICYVGYLTAKVVQMFHISKLKLKIFLIKINNIYHKSVIIAMVVT